MAPVRLAIALVFLYWFDFTIREVVDSILKPAFNRILGWSSLAAVVVVLVVYILNWPLAMYNISVSWNPPLNTSTFRPHGSVVFRSPVPH